MMELQEIARNTIKAKLEGKGYEVPEKIKHRLADKRACFVTLKKHGQLRGCVGSLQARQALWKDIQENAINAAFHDFRFPALHKHELDNLEIEISVLSKPEKLGIGKQVYDKITKDVGVILKHPDGEATFLPQVWEQLPDKRQFLQTLSRKAGLQADAWQEAEIWVYKVEKY
ncbi:MAG: AmmeMemoRadiSam system protein A [Candidatus Nanoarchaeia archaeon]